MRIGTRSLVAMVAVGLALGNLGRIPSINILGRGGAVAVTDLLLLPLWALLLVTLARGTRHWRLTPFDWSMLAFVSIAAISTLLAGPKWDLSVGAHLGVAAFLVRWVLYSGWYLVIVTDPDPDAAGRDAWRYMEMAILAMLVFGILQSALLPNFGRIIQEWTGLVYDHQGRRLVSSVLDPNFAGGLLAIVLVMRLAKEAEGIRTNRFTMLALVIGIVLTLSRATWLALIVAFALLVLIRGLRGQLLRLAAVGAALLVAALPAIYTFGQAFNKFEVDASAMLRFSAWIRSAIMLRDNPFFGVGFNAAGPAQWSYGWETTGGATTSMDGGVLFVAVLTGLFGVTAYLAMVWYFFRAARRTWRDETVPAERRAFAVGGWLALVVIIVQSLPGNALLTQWIMLPLWIIQARVIATAPAPVRNARSLRSALRVPAKVAAVAPVFLLLLLAGCDPCAGVASCSGASQIALTGTIIDSETRAPRAGVRVRVGSTTSVTDATGRWLIEMRGENDTTVGVEVSREGRPSYVATENVRASTRIGEAQDVGLWYDRPMLNSVVGVSRAGTFGPATTFYFELDSAAGGAEIQGQFAAPGFALIRGPAPNIGRVSGTLVVSCCGLGLRRYPGFPIDADYRVEIERIRGVLDVGRTYRFGGNTYHRGMMQHLPGATVTWTRTGGLATTPTSVTTTAGFYGGFEFGVDIHGWGEAIGTLTVSHPSGATVVTPNVRLETYPDLIPRSLGIFVYGEQWLFLMNLRRASDSTAIAFTPVSFTRDSGVVITPAVVNATTTVHGQFYLGAAVNDSGTVYGTLRFHPAGQPSYSAGTVALRTYPSSPIPTQPFIYVAVP